MANQEPMNPPGAIARPAGARLPAGVRDYPPGPAAALDSCLAGLRTVFEAHGYRTVYTPWFELLRSLEVGLGADAQARSFHLVDPGSGEVLVLRPDFTAQVARMVAARMGPAPRPLRLAYHGRVARAVDALGRGLGRRDLFQAGVELIGAPGGAADREVLRLAALSFHHLGRALTLDLSHAGILDALAPMGLGAEVRLALGARDEVALAQRAPNLLPLLHLRGGPEVLSEARRILGDTPPIRRALEDLEVALHGLAELKAPVSVDLAEVRGFGDYTGLVFRGYVDGARDAVVSGGRYDRLLGRFGQDEPAIGFGVDVGLVVASQAPPSPRGVVVLGAPGDAGAEAEADRIRSHGEPAVVVAKDAEAYARHHGFRAVARPSGPTFIESPLGPPDRP